MELSKEERYDILRVLAYDIQDTRAIIKGFEDEGYNPESYAHMTEKEKRIVELSNKIRDEP